MRQPDSEPEAQPRAFGLSSAVALVVANMIGAGVFTTSGFSLDSLGSRQWVMLAWGVAGLIAIAGAVSYGGLARHITESGGEYLFLSRCVHPLAGFVAGWVSLVAGFTGAIAASAITFATYAVPGRGDLEKPLAIAIIIVFGLIHAQVQRPGVVLQNLIVAAKLALVLFLLLFAAGHAGDWPGLTVQDVPAEPFSIFAFAGSLVWISFSFSGFNAAVYVASEVRDARRNVSRALWVGTLLVTVVYIALNAVFLYVPTPDAILQNKPVIADTTARALGGEQLALVVRIVICLALLSSVSSMIIAGPRVYAKMAGDGVFPALFRFRRGGAALAIGLQSVLAVGFVVVSELQDLLTYLGLVLSVSAAGTAASLFVLARREGPTFSAPGYPLVPAFYIVTTLVLAAMSIVHHVNTASAESVGKIVAAVGTLVLGCVIWLLTPRQRNAE